MQSISLLQGCLSIKTDHQPWVDWCLMGGTRLSSGRHMLYRHSIAHFHGSSKIENVSKFDARWWKMLQCCCYSQFLFLCKVCVWRVIIEGLPLGSTLNRRGLKVGTRFFCIVQLEDNKHLFIQCPIAHALEI